MVEDGKSWRHYLTHLRAAVPISFEAIIAILVVLMVLAVMLFDYLRDPNKLLCHPMRGCSESEQHQSQPSSEF